MNTMTPKENHPTSPIAQMTKKETTNQIECTPHDQGECTEDLQNLGDKKATLLALIKNPTTTKEFNELVKNCNGVKDAYQTVASEKPPTRPQHQTR